MIAKVFMLPLMMGVFDMQIILNAIMTKKFTVIIEKGEDGYLLSDVVELPGCHTQAKTLDELLKRTKEAISLYLKSTKDKKIYSNFLGVQQIEV